MNTGLLDMNGWKLQASLFYSENDYVLRAGAAFNNLPPVSEGRWQLPKPKIVRLQ